VVEPLPNKQESPSSVPNTERGRVGGRERRRKGKERKGKEYEVDHS
jgi:hypothetical protein